MTSRITQALCALLLAASGAAEAVVIVPVGNTAGAVAAQRAREEQAAKERAAAAVATTAIATRGGPCWYQVPGKMQLVNLNLVQEVVVQAADKGMQPVLLVMPLRRVEFEIPQTEVASLFPRLMALTQACAGR